MSLRALGLLALLAACPSKPPDKPAPIDDTAVRIRIAYAEARRGGGLAELGDLVAHGKKHERVLALRGLGRIGGVTARKLLLTAVADPDADISAAAAAAIGVMESLDETGIAVTAELLAALQAHEHVAIIEALGRAGDAGAQPTLEDKLASTSVDIAEQAALALARHGRRKIPISDDARYALAKATTHADVRVRYAATYALAREFSTKLDDPKFVAVTPYIVARIADQDPEVRAQAVAALARRKQAGAPQVEQALIDPDWRVAVEAVRALSADAYRPAVAAAVVRPGPGREHARLEAARSFKFDESWKWLTGMATVDEVLVEASKNPKPYLLFTLMADWVKAKRGSVADRRNLVRIMLTASDVRVRAAAVGTLPTLWPDGDDKDHDATIKMLVGAIASKDPILSGSAIDAADEILELLKDTKVSTYRDELTAAIVFRADGETDVELAASLFGVIGKRAIGQGLAACQKGLAAHPVLVKAANDCVKKLGGTPVDLSDPREAKPPLVDVTSVIGKQVTWHLKTSKGDFDIELRPDVAPWAVATVVALTKRGYYDGLDFHRVVPNFVVQGGDPTESGWGGPGFMIPAEPGSVLDGPGFVAGGVGIADAGRDSGGSQWFVMHSRATHLDGRYTWIGNVVGSSKSADALQIGDEVVKATIEIAGT